MLYTTSPLTLLCEKRKNYYFKFVRALHLLNSIKNGGNGCYGEENCTPKFKYGELTIFQTILFLILEVADLHSASRKRLMNIADESSCL